MSAARRTRARVRHVHSSSRFDRTPASLLRAARYYMTQADLVTFTEVHSNRRVRALRYLPGWRWVQVSTAPGADECGLLFNRKRYRFIAKQAVRLTNPGVGAFRGGQAVYALCVWLEDRATGQRFLVVVVHFPAHIEGARWFRAGDNTYLFQNAVAQLGKELAGVFAEDPDLPCMVVADWNLSMRRDWVLDWINHHLPARLASSWGRKRLPLPEDGTHGSRLIDDTWSNMPLQFVRLLPDDMSSDHRPYMDCLLLPE